MTRVFKSNSDDTEAIHIDEMPVGWDDIGSQREHDLVMLDFYKDSKYQHGMILSEYDTKGLIDELQRIVQFRTKEENGERPDRSKLRDEQDKDNLYDVVVKNSLHIDSAIECLEKLADLAKRGINVEKAIKAMEESDDRNWLDKL